MAGAEAEYEFMRAIKNLGRTGQSDEASTEDVPNAQALARRLERFNKREITTRRLPPDVATLAALYNRVGAPNNAPL